MLVTTARVFLALDVLIFFYVGQILWLDPQRLGVAGLEFVSPETSTAVRTWGGFFVASGLIGLVGVLSRRWTLPSLVAVSIITGCVVAARLFGISVDGVEPRQLSELRDESLGLSLALLGLLCAWFGQRGQASADR